MSNNNEIIFENEIGEKILFYTDTFSTSMSFISDEKKDVILNIYKDSNEYKCLDKMFEKVNNEAKSVMPNPNPLEQIVIDSDIVIDDKNNELLITKKEDMYMITLKYNTKNNCNIVKILSPYFQANTNHIIYNSLLSLYFNMKSSEEIQNQFHKTKRYK